MGRHGIPTGLGEFAIGFDQRDRARLHTLWDEILDSNRWSQGSVVEAFEAAWEAWNGLPAVAMSSWSGAALAALEFAGVRGAKVLDRPFTARKDYNPFDKTTYVMAHYSIPTADGKERPVDLAPSWDKSVQNRAAGT